MHQKDRCRSYCNLTPVPAKQAWWVLIPLFSLLEVNVYLLFPTLSTARQGLAVDTYFRFPTLRLLIKNTFEYFFGRLDFCPFPVGLPHIERALR
jgi:hypothetical protein